MVRLVFDDGGFTHVNPDGTGPALSPVVYDRLVALAERAGVRVGLACTAKYFDVDGLYEGDALNADADRILKKIGDHAEWIEIYNHGKMKRDFTYIDDLVRGIVALIDAVPSMPDAGAEPITGDSLSPVAPHRAVNIGTGSPVQLLDFVKAIEAAIGIEAQKIYMDIQPGDVPATWAEASLLKFLTGEAPVTPIETGIQSFVDWYRDYYQV